MKELLISINDEIFTSTGIKCQCDLDGTIIKRRDGKQWEIKFDYKKKLNRIKGKEVRLIGWGD